MSTQLDWRSTRLTSSFLRAVIGFDLRRMKSLQRLFLTSYNDKVRYEEVMEAYESQLSVMNVFPIDPTNMASLTIPADGCIVAFDLPVDYLAYLAKGNVSNPPSLPITSLDSNWHFMGFDVVDPRTQSSALNEFELPKHVLSEGGADHGQLSLNDHGLIVRPEEALRAAIFFDEKFPEHRPFVPCGIWLKVQA
jgi:hypothetical protein